MSDQLASRQPLYSWPALEAVLHQRRGWKLKGREWHGPCPLKDDGEDTCWFHQGHTAEIAGGCRKCGVRFTAHSLLEHLRALFGENVPDPATRGEAWRWQRARDQAPPTRNPWFADLWETTISPDDTPGRRYLVDERAVWLADRPLPPAVRWLPAPAAADLRVRRDDWPEDAVGCLVYRLAAPAEVETWALKVEAIDAAGRALRFGRGGKRPSLSRSNTDRGRRVFLAGGDPDRGIRLVEGPLDALALVSLGVLGAVDLAGAAVLGADGVGGFTKRACHGSGSVVLYPDGARWDEARERWKPEAALRAVQLMDELERAGRGRVRIVRQPRGQDIADEAYELIQERNAIQAEG